MTIPSDGERPSLQRGSVVQYPYLWRRQLDQGETEGRKDRPVCVLIAVRRDDDMVHLCLLAITSQVPSDRTQAIEVPEIERRRAGLDRDRPAWIIVDEYNYDVLGRSFSLSATSAVQGRFSAAFLAEVSQAAQAYLSLPGTRVDRT